MKGVLTKTELARYEKVEPPRSADSNFLYSFKILPKSERKAINSIYSFCSYMDDIVDGASYMSEDAREIKKKRLEWWEKTIDDIYNGNLNGGLLNPLIWVIRRYHLPKQYFLTLIDGVKRDLYQDRYETFGELKNYCFGVASVVGLISIEIFGYKHEDTKTYAINLGYALQLTNILRDIKQDKDRGYVYLPIEDLEKFNYSESELANEVYNDNFIELMRFQVKRAREFYHTARKYLHPEEKMTVGAAEVMDAIYYRLLEKIELNDYDVFNKRIKVSNVHKLMTAIKHWLSVKLFVKRIKKD